MTSRIDLHDVGTVLTFSGATVVSPVKQRFWTRLNTSARPYCVPTPRSKARTKVSRAPHIYAALIKSSHSAMEAVFSITRELALQHCRMRRHKDDACILLGQA